MSLAVVILASQLQQRTYYLTAGLPKTYPSSVTGSNLQIVTQYPIPHQMLMDIIQKTKIKTSHAFIYSTLRKYSMIWLFY